MLLCTAISKLWKCNIGAAKIVAAQVGIGQGIKALQVKRMPNPTTTIRVFKRPSLSATMNNAWASVVTMLDRYLMVTRRPAPRLCFTDLKITCKKLTKKQEKRAWKKTKGSGLIIYLKP